ncbi:MAG: U32 family peptidase [Candidatus Omnitrophica bacterium]|nr:U32 family peptidase [Candidatus Omnitrophota bacterium]MBU4468555.1 U32 family peptidase [Candidatus Omnitrophota bacterium]MCG2707771.1 U32 family peptidase [Candidatus Omnitrophota bacterium]
MKIKAPLTHKKEVAPLCAAGADEFFCGIEPYNWRRKYKDFSINQRSTGVNFTKLADLEKAILAAHRYKTKVHVAVNAFFYLEEQYKAAQTIIKDVLNIGADGIIFADPGLLRSFGARNDNNDKDLLKNKDVVMGCDAAIFNSAAVKFYKRLGATRIVFPRSMTIGEIKDVVEADNSLEYEVFIIHDLCFFEDGFCAYCKEQAGSVKKEGRAKRNAYFFTASRLPLRGYGGGCRTSFKRQKISVTNNKQIGKIKPFTFWMKKHIEGCGACAIYDFKKIGITNLKVLDRNLPTEEKIKATVFIRKSLGFLESNISKTDYMEKCKELFKNTFKIKCNQYDCYYPLIQPDLI